MLKSQKHRGPDDSGIRAFSLKSSTSFELPIVEPVAIEENFEGIIGFNRLSILDLSQNGHQPMCSSDGRIILTLNGEIYNAFDFKPELIADRFHFRSTTDTEVVLYLYIKYGFRGMVEKLNGMFSIVIIDLNEGNIYIARDRFGIKPMYYYLKDEVFAFSSELKSFYYLKGFNASLNAELLDEYLMYRNNINNTLIKDIYGLEPGHYLTYDHEKGLTKTKYFDINDYSRVTHHVKSFEEELYKLKSILSKSVKSQLMSDVKLGCQLSGGVDSSIVTWLANEIKRDNLLESVSVVFDNPKFSESIYINQVVHSLGIVSHQFPLKADFYQQNLEHATWHFEGPINHPNTIGLYLLAQRAKEHVTVLLSGEGADEIFGGYGRINDVMYPYSNRRFFYGLKKSWSNPIAYLKQHADPVFRAISGNAFMTKTMAQMLKPDFNYECASTARREIYESYSGSTFDKQVKYEVNTYLPDLLLRQDKMSMAHSIENRVPFLDNNVVAHSFTLPVNYLFRKNAIKGLFFEKYILKKLSALAFGDKFSFRNKMGFGIPLREFMNNPAFNAYLNEQIIPGIAKRGLLNSDSTTYWANNLHQIDHTALSSLWIAISLEIWIQKFIDIDHL